MPKKGYKQTKECIGKRTGSNHYRWHGGRKKGSHGYILILKPNHPFCYRKGYILEHRLVMETHLGRYLTPKEEVHHRNDIKDDNRIENLRLFPNKNSHSRFHRLNPFLNKKTLSM